jgi:hypothetical protein
VDGEPPVPGRLATERLDMFPGNIVGPAEEWRRISPQCAKIIFIVTETPISITYDALYRHPTTLFQNTSGSERRSRASPADILPPEASDGFLVTFARHPAEHSVQRSP